MASLSEEKSNTALAWISSVRSFFTNEAVSIKLQNGKIPTAEMAMDEHRFTLNELRAMWLVADTEGKARLSVSVSLGWGVGEILNLKTDFVKGVLRNVDGDGFASFDYRRQKTKARIRGILTPTAVSDVENYLKRVPEDQEYLWSVRSKVGFNNWLKGLFREAGISENGTIRFHLIRKYVFDMVSSQCGLYEAKLLVGKKIPLADATYLHGLEDRLLEKYKKFASPLLLLNGHRVEQTGKIEVLEEKLAKTSEVLDYLQGENLDLKSRLRRIEESRRESDDVMNRLFEDENFLTRLKERLKEIS